MALIKCPSCGQTVLSIASVCPKCGHMLMQNPHAQGEDGEFVECPRCNKFIPHTAERCGFCSYPRRARRRLWWAIGTVAVVTALVTAVYGYRQVFGRGETPTPTAQTPEGPTPAAAPIESPTAGGEEQEPAPSAEPTVVTQSVPGASDSVRAAPAAGAEVTPPPAPPRRPRTVPSTVNRWATTWANLREGPGTDYPVVRVLEPGERIRVASPTRGFWAVYDDNAIEGYVANSLLSDRQPPPDSLPVTPPSRTR